MTEPTAKTYTTRPYRVEYPDSTERGRSCKTLEDAIADASWHLHRVWRETGEYGIEGEYIHDTERAVITNRNTGYRWIMRRGDRRIEFQTPGMLESDIAEQHVDLHISVEEAEAIAIAASAAPIKDRRTKALVDQALDQVAMVCATVRERVRGADDYFDWLRGLPIRPPDDPEPEVSVDQDTTEQEHTETAQEASASTSH